VLQQSSERFTSLRDDKHVLRDCARAAKLRYGAMPIDLTLELAHVAVGETPAAGTG
jgi:hypothetical protein